MPDDLEKHRFWSKQPVCTPDGQIGPDVSEPVDLNCDLSQTPTCRTPLPPGYSWCVLDVRDPKIIQEVSQFLFENYVEDTTSTFKLCYPIDVLRWALVQPGYIPDTVIGVRQDDGTLLATIAATPDKFYVRKKAVELVVVDFLCVHKSLRSKRLSPVLIKEVTRLSNLHGIASAFHTGSIELPTCLSSPIYFHRLLNPKRLIDAQFCIKPEKIPISLYCKKHKTPTEIKIIGLREMRESDVETVTKLLNDYQKQFQLAKIFTEEYVKMCLLPKKGVISSYVVENNGKVTDFICFYTLESTSVTLKNSEPLKLAMLYYYAVTVTSLENLVNDAIFMAKQQNHDVMNALEIMNNKTFLKPLKFVEGTGKLRYYLYNWKCSAFSANEIGVFTI